MTRTFLAVLAATAIAMPVVGDEIVEFNAALAFNPAALSTETGATEVFVSLKEQALALCERKTSISAIPLVDEACVSDVLSQAVTDINSPALFAAFSDSEFFAEPEQLPVTLAAR